ncbi:MAG: hypothetical protein IKW13_05890, partial [Thermoguttaceae bacterium]|nr:hypothetical protein [Thermoguttaceae bacterium]
MVNNIVKRNGETGEDEKNGAASGVVFENFNVDASTVWTPRRKEIVGTIARVGVNRFVKERGLSWSNELTTFFQSLLATCAGVPEETKRFWKFLGFFERNRTPGLWDSAEAFAKAVDATLEKWSVAHSRHFNTLQELLKSENLSDDERKLLRRIKTSGDAEGPLDYLAAVSVAQGRGFKGKGNLGGSPFRDLAFVVAASSRNKNAADLYDSFYKESLKRALWAKIKNIEVLKTSDFDNWYVDLKNDVLYDVETTKSYAGDSGLAGYLASVCLNDCRRKLKRSPEEKNAGFLRLDRSAPAPTQNVADLLAAGVKRNLDGSLRGLAPRSGFDANVRRRAYALHIGPSRPGEAALIEEKARQYAKSKDAGRGGTTKAELDDLTRTTKLSSEAIGALLGCSHSRVETLFAGVQREVLGAVAQAYKEVCGSGGTSLLKEGVAFYRAADARVFCETLDVLERVATDEDVGLAEMNEELQNALEILRNLETKVVELKEQAEKSREAAIKEIADLSAEKKRLERELKSVDCQRETAANEWKDVKETLKNTKARRDACRKIAEEQETLVAWLSAGRAGLEQVNPNAGWERMKS